MLVLSRQRDETIMIGDDIEITVVDIRGDKVRLGINAPTRIAVHRKEVYEAIKAENEQAARASGEDLTEIRHIAGTVSPSSNGGVRGPRPPGTNGSPGALGHGVIGPGYPLAVPTPKRKPA